jgi:hypothetical protein
VPLINHYPKGSDVVCRGTFTNALGGLIDPDVVIFQLRTPGMKAARYVYGADAQVVRESQGVYAVTVDGARPGTYFYGFTSTGSGKAANEKTFVVDSGSF